MLSELVRATPRGVSRVPIRSILLIQVCDILIVIIRKNTSPPTIGWLNGTRETLFMKIFEIVCNIMILRAEAGN